ncbi:glycosyltransferase [Falsarthrobacter nasiphocae]|uniref:glycosyltransferase n=1 Tax=Falsarthrobacter nasiphocae TaxID=189863 RepID=UPI0031E06524
MGPPTHGVALYAAQMAEALGAEIRRASTPEDALRAAHEIRDAGLERVHLHVTDHLFGRSPAEAAESIEGIAAVVGSLSLTLHDIPQASDGPRNLRRRSEAYARIIRAADAVVLNSRHEKRLLREAGIPAAPLTGVIPLPLVPGPRAEGAAEGGSGPEAGARGAASAPEAAVADGSSAEAAAQRAGRPATLGLFGYIYPGKGHAELIEAAARQDPPARVLALGAVATGHDELVRELTAAATARGVDFEVTGFIEDADLPAQLERVDVPVCFHRHFSASGSLNTWISAGRRPLAPDTRYTREMADLRPGTLTLVPDEASLAGAVRRALADPASTRLAPGSLPHGLADAAAEYARFFERAAAGVPQASVVVPYYDDGTSAAPAERLRLILDAIKGQSARDLDVVVADDGSPQPPHLPGWARLVRQEDRGFRAAAARGLGADAAWGQTLVFLDADTVPDPDFVERLTAPLLTGEADLAVGRRDHAWLTGPEAGTPLDSPAWLRDAYARTENLAAADARAYQLVISAVLAVRRDLFEEIGGFDESLSGYGGEDWELAHRAWEAGARMIHVPEARAVHDGPDWGERDGRSHERARREKNAETRALAERIPAGWTRPAGVVFARPELAVRCAGGAWDADDGDALAAWIGALLAVRPDARVELPAGAGPAVAALFAADPRVGVGEVRGAETSGSAAEEGGTAARAAGARFTLVVSRLFEPGVLPAAMAALDDAPENGELGGVRRRAVVVIPSEPAPQGADAAPQEKAGPPPRVAARLTSARAEALRARGLGDEARQPEAGPEADAEAGPEADAEAGLAVEADAFPRLPDLERTWAGW